MLFLTITPISADRAEQCTRGMPFLARLTPFGDAAKKCMPAAWIARTGPGGAPHTLHRGRLRPATPTNDPPTPAKPDARYRVKALVLPPAAWRAQGDWLRVGRARLIVA